LIDRGLHYTILHIEHYQITLDTAY